MRKVNYFLAVLFIAVSGVYLSGCSEDEEVDIRDNVTGTYNYTLKIYYEEAGSLTYLGSDTDEIGTMIVEKNANNSSTLNFLEGGELAFQVTKVEEASNAIVFDIASQIFTEEGESYTIIGYDYWDLEGTKYHGAYSLGSKKIETAFKFDATVEGVPFTFVFVYEGTKQ